MMNASIASRRLTGGALVLALLLGLAFAPGSPAQDQAGGGFPDLAKGLREIEGCIGVETAQASSGKQVIFAWFEDKEAAARWYYSEMHQGAMAAFFPDREELEGHEAMEHVPENVGPILAIASITFGGENQLDEVALPISQIAIELYTPLSGGLALGGRFAPKGLEVPKRRIIVDEEG